MFPGAASRLCRPSLVALSLRRVPYVRALPHTGFLSVSAAAAWAHVSSRTLRRWLRAGLPSYQPIPGGRIFLIASELERFIRRRLHPQPVLDALVEGVMQELDGRRNHNPNRNKRRVGSIP